MEQKRAGRVITKVGTQWRHSWQERDEETETSPLKSRNNGCWYPYTHWNGDKPVDVTFNQLCIFHPEKMMGPTGQALSGDRPKCSYHVLVVPFFSDHWTRGGSQKGWLRLTFWTSFSTSQVTDPITQPGGKIVSVSRGWSSASNWQAVWTLWDLGQYDRVELNLVRNRAHLACLQFSLFVPQIYSVFIVCPDQERLLGSDVSIPPGQDFISANGIFPCWVRHGQIVLTSLEIGPKCKGNRSSINSLSLKQIL